MRSDRISSAILVAILSIAPFALAANDPPSARIAPIAPVECADGVGVVGLDGSASSDPNGDPLTFAWSAAAGSIDDASAATTRATLPRGSTMISLGVSDGIDSSMAQASAEVVDTIAPSSSLAIAAPDGLAGWYRAGVAGSIAATDACDASPSIHASLDGATVGGSVQVEGDGVHALSYSASDASGNAEASRRVAIAIDGTPPILTPMDQALVANMHGGTTRAYALPDLRDATSGAGPIACAPDVGSFLPLGTTTIACEGRDVAGNAASTSFRVTVVPAPVDHVVVTPARSLTNVGRELPLSAAAFDVYDNAIPDATAFTWAAATGKLSTASGPAAGWTPATPGTSAITATIDGVTGRDVAVATTELRLTPDLFAALGDVHGEILAQYVDGTPVDGALVTLDFAGPANVGGVTSASGPTDASGRLSFEAPPAGKLPGDHDLKITVTSGLNSRVVHVTYRVGPA